MTTFGVPSEKVGIKTLSEIVAGKDAALRAVFGAHINTSAQSVLGQLIGIFAKREALLWEIQADIFNTQYPATAEGASPDSVTIPDMAVSAWNLETHTRL